MVIEARDIDDLTNDATPEASDHQRIRASLLSLSRPARDHLLCTWLEADWYPGILPFLRLLAGRVLTPGRAEDRPPRSRGEQSPFPWDKEIRRKPKEGSRDTHLSLAFQFSATFSCSQLLGSCTSYRISEFLYSKWGVFVGWSYPCATRWIIVFLVYIIFQI